MTEWKDLIYKKDISYLELKMIPGASCENYIAMKNYFVKEYGYKEEDLLRGLTMTKEEFNNPKNWINSRDEQLFHINLFKYGHDSFTHHDYVEAGRFFRFSDNSLFMIFFKAMSAGKIIKEIEKNIRKFNNEYNIIPALFKSGEAYLIQEDYPFYNQASVGGECRFTEGVWKANFEIHNIKNYSVDHVICSKRLENLLTYGYGYYNLKVEKDDKYLRVNGKPVAEFVELATKKIGNNQVFINSVVENGINKNALRVIDDFKIGKRTILFKGEIYNAPYCLFHLKWKEHSLFKRLYNALKGQNLLIKSLSEIEKQIEFTNLQLFELKQALSESDRRLRIMEVYTRYSLIQKIKGGEDPSTFIPEQRNLSVLFNDIRQFTTITENLNALDVVTFLNDYYNNVNEVINCNHGEIDKLIGDSVMAGFSDPDNAVKAGIAIKLKVSEYNKKLASEGKDIINTGIGITNGHVIIGNIGSVNKLDYTLIGDTVNVASRLEALTKEYRVGFIISEDLKQVLKDLYQIRFIDRVRVKGRNKAISVYEVYDYERENVIALKKNMKGYLEEAYDHYYNKNFEASQKIYKALLDKLPHHSYFQNLPIDPLVLFYYNRVTALIDKQKKGLFDTQYWDATYDAVEK